MPQSSSACISVSNIYIYISLVIQVDSTLMFLKDLGAITPGELASAGISLEEMKYVADISKH